MGKEEFDSIISMVLSDMEEEIEEKNLQEDEVVRANISALLIVKDTCNAIFKVVPDFDIPLIRISSGYDLHVVEVVFEIFTYKSLCILGAYASCIQEYLNKPVINALENMLLFVVADTNQVGDDVSVQTYDIWKVLQKEFLITKQENNKLSLLVNTGQGFLKLIEPK